ncbi:hypothetical protein E2I00_007668, partial [Balaenoptera physalus]
KIKALGEDDPWLDDTAAWIERTRQLQKEKDLAERRDESVDDLAQAGRQRGLRAETVALWLFRSRQKPRSVLSKYDEELEGERLQSFRLEQGGVVEIVRRLESRQRGWEEEEDPERKGAIVFNATSEFCRTLGEIPTYGLAGNREEQEELMDFERDEERSANGGSESDGEENIGWSTVNLDEEKQQQDVHSPVGGVTVGLEGQKSPCGPLTTPIILCHPQFSASSTTILDEEPIVNRGLAAALLLCQNKVTVAAGLSVLHHPIFNARAHVFPCKASFEARAIDDKYSRREEYRGFTQDFKEKDGYKPDVKIEYVDETGRKLTPKELLKKMSSSDTPLGTVALLQEKQKAQKTPYIVLSGSGKSMNANTITK